MKDKRLLMVIALAIALVLAVVLGRTDLVDTLVGALTEEVQVVQPEEETPTIDSGVIPETGDPSN